MKENINPALEKLAVVLTDLHLDPTNARKHEQRSIDAIKASYTEYGQQKPIVVLNDGMIIAGNGSYEAARQLGWKKIAVVRFADAAKARAFALMDNRSAELSSWDDLQLAQTLDELGQLPEWDPASVGFTDDEMMKLLAANEEIETIDNTPATAAKPGAPAVPPPPAGPPSHVRMVQLFLDDKTHPRFMEAVKKLARSYGTTNATDTVLRAIEDLASRPTQPESMPTDGK